MNLLSISDLKRLTPPFASKSDEEAAARYWSERPREERVEAYQRLTREFYRSLGIDLEAPMDKTVRWITLEEKNRDGEQWHRAYEEWHAKS